MVTCIVWLLASILATKIGVVCVLGGVAILKPSKSCGDVVRTKRYKLARGPPTLIQGTGTKVKAQVRLGTDHTTPFHELVRPELIGLETQPSKLRPMDKSVHRQVV